MVTPLGISFSSDEQIMAQGDVSFMKKTVESLIVNFDKAKYEEFLSSGSKSPRVARQYRKVSVEIRSQVPLEASPKMACINSIISGSIARAVRVNISHETREANVIEGQSCYTSSLPQFQATGDP